MEKLKPLIEAKVEELGYYLYNLNYNKKGSDYVLSVEIDAKEPIGIDDCVKVSEALSTLLDKADPFDNAYMLEVISAGAEHPLRNLEEMQRAIGKFVHIKTLDQTYEGTLVAVSENAVELLDKKNRKTMTIFQSDIETIRLAIDF